MMKKTKMYYRIYTEDLYPGLQCYWRPFGEYSREYCYDPDNYTEDMLYNVVYQEDEIYPHMITKEDLESPFRKFCDKYITVDELSREFIDWKLNTGNFYYFVKDTLIVIFDIKNYTIEVISDMWKDDRGDIYYGRCRSLNDLKRLRQKYNF